MDKHVKDLYVNCDLGVLTNLNGQLANSVIFTNKDNTLLRWHIFDNSGAVVDLSSGTFELIIGSSYNDVILTIPNSGFVSADWASYSLANGRISCRVNFGDSAITNFMSDAISEPIYGSLWATITGKRYLLCQFEGVIKNTIRS